MSMWKRLDEADKMQLQTITCWGQEFIPEPTKRKQNASSYHNNIGSNLRYPNTTSDIFTSSQTIGLKCITELHLALAKYDVYFRFNMP